MDVFASSSGLKNPDSEYGSSKSRVIKFSGTRNFRQLGGYHAADGRMIRQDLLYRAGSLHRLSTGDLARLSGLSLNLIIDFRADFEKASEPDRLPGDSITKVVEIPILDTSTQAARSLEKQIRTGRVDGIKPDELMVQLYIQLATQFTPQYRQFVHEVLLVDGKPLLFHCTAGKDRTGFAAAILMRLLDVHPETVLYDYLLSNQYYLKPIRRYLMLLALLRGRKAARVVTGFLEAKPLYFDTAFRTIDEKYGSFDGYVRDGLNLTDAQVEKLRSLYLR